MSADTKIAELLTELHHLIKRTQVNPVIDGQQSCVFENGLFESGLFESGRVHFLSCDEHCESVFLCGLSFGHLNR